jgi:hypothetical protein
MMKTVSYMTLAAVRNVAPAEFDRVIKEAVLAAGMEVGADVVFSALSNQKPVDSVVQELKRVA